jgi:acyl carrier protein
VAVPIVPQHGSGSEKEVTSEMSNRDSVKATVLEILSDVVTESVDDLLAQPVLAVHEWDSLATLEALVQFESKFGITLDLRSYHGAREINNLVDLILAAQGLESTTVRP